MFKQRPDPLVGADPGARASSSPDVTDDEDALEEADSSPPEMQGNLHKWTNYLHGWQERFMLLKEGTLTYFKSETDRSYGCRGAISLGKAIIVPHQFDECRFDVSVNDSMWYLRAETPEERRTWLDALEVHRQAESGYGSENGLRRQGSMLSIASGTSMSAVSTSSSKGSRGLLEKLAEMETFRDILCRQVDTLQGYFDACSEALSVLQMSSVHDRDYSVDADGHDGSMGEAVPGDSKITHSALPGRLGGRAKDDELAAVFRQHGAHAIDFKGEAITFKATTAGVLATLSHCMELMAQREDTWKKRLERECDRRKRLEAAYKQSQKNLKKTLVISGPDYEEGPHCIITEDEFFDAVDASLDKLDSEAERLDRRHAKECSSAAVTGESSAAGVTPAAQQRTSMGAAGSKVSGEARPLPGACLTLTPKHKYYEEVNRVIDEHLKYASLDSGGSSDGSGGGSSSWELLHEEGEMKVYRRELIEDGMVVDPLKAVHTVTGVTGHEICHYFFDFGVRMDWENTLESAHLLETVSADTVVSQQFYKRIWPTTQREALFWSHIRHVPPKTDDAADCWIVCNYSTNDHPSELLTKCVRVRINVALMCQTTVKPPSEGKQATRDDLTCSIQYSANVNPGGWAPASVLRAIYKREYPKFLKRFTQYVKDATADKPIMF